MVLLFASGEARSQITSEYCSGDAIILYSPVDRTQVWQTIDLSDPEYSNVNGTTDKSFSLVFFGSTITIIVHPTYDTTETADVCDSYTWDVDGVTYTSTQNVTKSFASAHGCDSIRKLELTIRNSTTASMNETACDSYDWVVEGSTVGTYTASTTETYTITNAVGCDSTITLHLTVNYNSNTGYTERLCRTGLESTYDWLCGSYYYESQTQATDGIEHTHTIGYVNSDGCPSVDTLRLTLYKNDTVYESNVKGCNSYEWRGTTYTVSGVQTHTDQTAVAGICDSVYICCIDIYADSTVDMEPDTVTVADYTWEHNGYMASRTLDIGTNSWNYTATGAVQGVCDSIFNITVNYVVGRVIDTMFCDRYTFTPRDGSPEFLVTTDTTVYDTVSRAINHTETDSIYTWNIRIRPTYSNSNPLATYPAVESDGNVCDSLLWYHDDYVEDYQNDPAENHVGDSVYLTGTTITATLRSRESEGLCDSVVVMHLLVHPSYRTVDAFDVLHPFTVEDMGEKCNAFDWHDSTYTASVDTATAFEATVFGCDSLVAMKVIVKHDTETHETLEDCGSYDNYSLELPHITRDTTLVFSFPASNGCDSLHHVHFRIYPTYDTIHEVEACGDYLWVNADEPTRDANDEPVNDSVYTVSATLGPVTYHLHPSAEKSCDSIVTLHLTILQVDTVYDVIEACYRYRHPVTDSIYTVSTTLIDTLSDISVNGCHIIKSTSLIIHDSVVVDTAIDACYQYQLFEVLHLVSTDTVGRFRTVHGCDSTVRYHITIHDRTEEWLTEEVCGDTVWYGIDMPEVRGTDQTYTADATGLRDAYGCDLTKHITMTVHSHGYCDTVVEACDHFDWYGTTYSQSGTASHASPAIVPRGSLLCDSITILNLTIYENDNVTLDTAACEQFEWYTQNYGESDVTYGGTFDSDNSSAAVTLRNMHGCDSTVHLNLTIHHASSEGVPKTVCDSTEWNGTTYTESGVYDYLIPNGNIWGCDSTAILQLTVNHSTTAVKTVADCNSYTWPLNGETYTHSTDIPAVTITNGAGCDSVVNLNLTIYEDNRNAQDDVTACDSMTWHGATYYATTDMPTFDTLTTHGCDSTVTLHLNVLHSIDRTVDTAVCDSSLWHTGVWYLTSTSFDDTLTARNGCDSINHVNLTIYPPNDTTEIYVEACDSYTWPNRGETYTLSGDYRDTLVARNTNCDSIVLMHLTIRHSDTVQNSLNTLQATACDSYTWHGNDYDQIGVYQFDTLNADGCTARLWLDLTIANTGRTDIPVRGCGSATWGAETFDHDTVILYQVDNSGQCDVYTYINIEIVDPIVVDETVTTCDSYTWTDGRNFVYRFTDDAEESVTVHRQTTGCDSTINLHLTVNHSSLHRDTLSGCDSYRWMLIDSVFYSDFDTLVNYTAITGVNNAAGCDSLIQMHINVRHSTAQRVDTVVCHGMGWNGVYYDHDTIGPVQYNLNAENCLNTDTLNLTVYTPDTAATVVTSGCDSIEWRGATYTTSGTYYQVASLAVHGVCDSVYPLQLTLYETQRDTLRDAACLSYTWNGQYIDQEGLYPSTRSGVAAGGCDSIHYLNLTLYGRVTEIVTIEACDSVTWHGITYYDNAYPSFSTLSIHGCDSIAYADIKVYHADTTSSSETLTACGNYIWKGVNYTETGLYHFDTLTVHGCDSTMWLHLTIEPYDIVDVVTVDNTSSGNCDSYDWTIEGHTHHYTMSGTYYDTVVPSTSYCGQLHQLNLTLRESTSDTVKHTQCVSYSYNGVTYTADAVIETGRDNGGNAVGCDSIHYLALTIVPHAYYDDVYDICDSLRWVDGNLYTADNNTATYQVPGGSTITGCDSTVNLRLTLRHSRRLLDTIVGCDSRRWYLVNRIYYEDTDTLLNYTTMSGVTNMEGCDSLIQMHISVPRSSATEDHIKSCEPVRWSNGVLYSSSIEGPTYLTRNAAGCDSVVTLKLEVYQHVSTYATDAACASFAWHGNEYTESGTYSDVHSGVIGGTCDSIYYLTLQVYNTGMAPIEHVVARRHYRWDRTGVDYNESTTATLTVPLAVHGYCDSVYTLNLEIYDDSIKETEQTVCNSYRWRGRNLVTTGTYRDTVFNAVHGVADSIYVLNLVVYTNDTTTYNVTACNEYNWEGDVLTTTNAYYHYDRLAVGGVCDKVYKLNLTVLHTYVDSSSVEVCGSYDWRGTHYNASGNYTVNVTSTATDACDSIFKLHLVVNPVYPDVHYNPVACDVFYWAPANRYYYDDASFVENFYTRKGCDSIVYVNLHVAHSSDRVSQRTMDACGSYTWPLTGVTYTASTTAEYSFSDGQACDSTIQLILTIHQIDTTDFVAESCDNYTWRGEGYAQSGTYYDTEHTAFGCDSILKLQLTVYPSHTDALFEATVCDSYLWHGSTYTASTQTPTYRTTTIHGCDSMVTLHLTVHYSGSEVVDVTACDSYTWHGNTYTTSTTTPVFHTQTTHGCDSTANLHLVMHFSSAAVFDTMVCDQLSWIDGHTYTSSTNTPTVVLTGANAGGCDSTVTLHLTVGRSTSDQTQTGCDSIVWNGTTYTESSDVVSTYTNVLGCDSVETYHLVVRYSTTGSESVTACDTYTWNGTTYDYEPVDATYVTLNEAGCDSTVTLLLTLHHTSTSVEEEEACDSYTWHGNTYTESVNVGEVSYLTTNSEGCDSTVLLILNLQHSVYSNITEQAVGQYIWEGQTYTTSGTYSHTYTAANGCDSVVTLRLAIINFTLPQIVVHNDRLLMVNHYPNGDGTAQVNYIAYRWYRNNTIIPNATSDSYNLPNYQVLHGCYYVEVPVDNTREMWVSSNTICIGVVGIDEADDFVFEVYPNPVASGSRVTVQSNALGGTVTVYDLQGREVMRTPVTTESTVFSVDLPAGIYTLRVTSPDGNGVAKKLIVR